VEARGVERLTSLADLLEASARRSPDAVALVTPGGARVTYRELDDRADRVAGFLLERGVEPGDRVGFSLHKGAASVAILFGAMKVRAAYVPVDVLGPATRNAAILTDCGVRALFVDEARDDLVRALGEVPPESVVRVKGEDLDLPASDPSRSRSTPAAQVSRAARDRRDLAYILYTSGSTGVPKGVMVTHENALAFVDWCSATFKPTASDRFSSHAPFHFDLSVLDLFVSLKHGATLCLIGEELGKDPRSLAKWIAGQRITMWYSTPSVLALLSEFGGLERQDLSALRVVNFAGELFPIAALRRLTRQIPSAAFFNLYGPTETNVCTFAPVALPIPDERTRPVPIGALCSHCEGRVADEELVPVAPVQSAASGAGENEGLLWIAGPSLFQGYWNRPDLNARLFVEKDGRRWYCTGDVVREDPREGLIFVGRRDRMIKRRGHRIELGEIEAALQRHPGLRETAVVALDGGETGVVIRAHVAGRDGAKPSIVALKRWCASELPASMSPDLFRFHEALPRTSTDKVDYQALLNLGANG
jgi:amino acid adenylation domain-containing protein